MGPQRRAKKQRTEAHNPTPLGAFLPAATAPPALDEDERALEEAVFGRALSQNVWDLAEEDRPVAYDLEDDGRETGLERITDDALFFVDVPTASTSKATLSSEGLFLSASESDDEPSPAPQRTNHRKPAWHDPADELLTVSLAGTNGARLRKLRNTPTEDTIGGIEYEARLRRQFEKLHPAPAWAVDARRKILRKRARVERGAAWASEGSGDENENDSDIDDAVDDLFRSTGTGRRAVRRGVLQPGEIDIDRVRDANQAAVSSSTVVAVGFHPSAQVLFSATPDRRLRLFQIDGTDNALLQTLHVPELPISSASYHPSGSSILLSGGRPFFLSYDLQTGQVIRSPRGLLSGGLGGSDRQSTGGAGGMERARFSPDGAMLAVGGRRGYVHLVDWGAGGVGNGGQVVGEVKMNVPVKGIAWQNGGRELLTLGEDSEVYVWDVGSRRCVQRWKDEGGFGACLLETDSRAKYTAVASSTGIVNIYDAAAALPSPGSERKALKAVGNLTTAVTSMCFNNDSQILALASNVSKDQLKLVHLPSATVFSNWPTQSTPLHHVTDLSFSKGSEYLAIGNARGKVLLYHLAYTRKSS